MDYKQINLVQEKSAKLLAHLDVAMGLIAMDANSQKGSSQELESVMPAGLGR
jgi:hypothetical protein